MSKIDPFTRTPGVVGQAFINMHYAESIINQFESDQSSKYIYKIVGLRGSGKSVEYSKVINHFSKKKGWLVYTLSSAGNPIVSLLAKMSREPFIDDKKRSVTYTAGGTAGTNAVVINGSANISVSKTSERDPAYFSEEADMSEMVKKAYDNGYRILIGIDDISKTPDMVKFLSIIGAMLLEDRTRLYFICTGLSNNIEDFSSEPNLTFFKRSDSIEIGALDKYEIALMYQKLLGMDEAKSIELSKFTCGYAYAYQVLGSLYHSKGTDCALKEILPEFDKILFQDCYDLIWNSLTLAEQDLVRCIINTDSGVVAEIREKMTHPSSYDSLRNRLRYKHLINTDTWGVVRIDLPRFKEYVLMWQS